MTFSSFIYSIVDLISNTITALLITIAVTIFIYTVFRFIISRRSGEGGEAMNKARKQLLWSTISLFLIFSIWGIVNLFQSIFKKDSSTEVQSSITLPSTTLSPTAKDNSSSNNSGSNVNNNPTNNQPFFSSTVNTNNRSTLFSIPNSIAISYIQNTNTPVCTLSQISNWEISTKDTFEYSIAIGNNVNTTIFAPEFTCDNGSTWKALPMYKASETKQSISNLPAGYYVCNVRLNSQNVCSGVIRLKVSENIASISSTNSSSGPFGSYVGDNNTTQNNTTSSNFTPPASGDYTVDDILPDPMSGFTELRSGQTNISNIHVAAETGGSGLRFPSWNNMKAGDKIRLAVLVPPGISYSGWRTEFNNYVATFGSCDTDGNTCYENSFTPVIYPYGFQSQLPEEAAKVPTLPANTTPKVYYITIKALSVPIWLLTLTINWTIKDPSLYNTWRSERKWAGGSGDCDGLGNKYVTGPDCNIKAW